MSQSGFPRPERQSFAPWRDRRNPPRVLLIRLHALGDIAVTLPAIRGFRLRCPDSQVDMLTLSTAAPFIRSLSLFDDVLDLPPASNPADRALQSVRFGSFVRARDYDLVVDLQRNWFTRAIRRVAAARAWGEFDRFSPHSAADRVKRTFEQCGFPDLCPSFDLSVSSDAHTDAQALLDRHQYDSQKRLIVLNPAGLWETRHWPLENYVALAQLWLGIEPVQFLLVGTTKVRDAATVIQSRLGGNVINLIEQTSVETAFALLGRSAGVISEDSGLMHLAWCQGVPVVALFGSSRHVWSAPVGGASHVFHSGDMECGQCMQPECRFGDVRCLARWSPREVLDAALKLLSRATGAAA